MQHFCHFALVLAILSVQNVHSSATESLSRWLAHRLPRRSLADAERIWRRVFKLTVLATLLVRVVTSLVAIANLIRYMEQYIASNVRSAQEGDQYNSSDLDDLAQEFGMKGAELLTKLEKMAQSGDLSAEVSEVFQSLKPGGLAGFKLPALPPLPILDWFCHSHSLTMHLMIVLLTAILLLPLNAWLLAAQRVLAEAETRRQREAHVPLDDVCQKIIEARLDLRRHAWAELDPNGSHPARLPRSVLVANGVAIGSDAAALKHFAQPLGLLPVVIDSRLVHSVHCVIGRENDTMRTVVEPCGLASVWRNGQKLGGRDLLCIGDQLRIGGSVVPYSDLTYKLVEPRTVLEADCIANLQLTNADSLVDATMKWLASRRQEMSAIYWCVAFSFLIVLIMIGLYLGLVALTNHLEISKADYLSVFNERKNRAGKGGKGSSEVSEADLQLSEKVVSPWSMFYLICVCIALPAILAMSGFMIMIVYGRKRLKEKTESTRTEMNRVAEITSTEDRKTAARLEEELDFIMPILCTVQNSKQTGLPSSFELHISEPCDKASEQTCLAPDVDDLRCPICLGVCTDCVALLPCGHNFCASCCSEHLSRVATPNCPLCTCATDRVVPNPLARLRIRDPDFLAQLSADDYPEQVPSASALFPQEGRCAQDLCWRPPWKRRLNADVN